jgi:hypothetical protein
MLCEAIRRHRIVFCPHISPLQPTMATGLSVLSPHLTSCHSLALPTLPAWASGGKQPPCFHNGNQTLDSQWRWWKRNVCFEMAVSHLPHSRPAINDVPYTYVPCLVLRGNSLRGGNRELHHLQMQLREVRPVRQSHIAHKFICEESYLQCFSCQEQ